MSIGAPDPSGGAGGGGAMTMAPPQGGAGGGQGVQILQQIQSLLAQLAQTETDPGVQRAVNSMSQLIDPLMQAVGASDQQNMTSGVANPTDPTGGMGAGPDTMGSLPGAGGGSEGTKGGAEPSSFKGASKAAAANFADKGHFSKSGSKGESLQTDKQKNRK